MKNATALGSVVSTRLFTKARLSAAASVALAGVPAFVSAATVTQTATDAAGSSSFNTGTRWSDGQTPSAANDYVTPGGAAVNTLQIRTPFDTGDTVFAGNSLTVGDNSTNAANLVLKNATNATITVNNLTLNKGSIQNGGNSGGVATALTFASNNITLGTGGGIVDSGGAGRSINVTGLITGAGTLSIIGGGTIQLSGANTYTGATTVGTGATLRADDGVGLASVSNLSLAGGSLVTSGTFSRALGTGAGQVQISGAGGFTANGGALTVALGGTASPTPLTVGLNGFAPTTMFLNNGGGTSTVDFRNSIDLAGTTTFGVNVSNATAATSATLSGNLTDSVGTGTFTKAGVGLLTLTGTNTYAGNTVITGGTLRAAARASPTPTSISTAACSARTAPSTASSAPARARSSGPVRPSHSAASAPKAAI
ncbi:MAG: autotransporter-associated beta strand repeat-containing protein [Tepidisphaeraceae bacterium]